LPSFQEVQEFINDNSTSADFTFILPEIPRVLENVNEVEA
jgi:hypothetical protein